MTSNPASEKVLVKAGMTYEGTLRQYFGMKGIYWDVKMYSILQSDYAHAYVNRKQRNESECL